ncbi:MAG: hypothetical protein ACXVKA_16735 [Acidimicrobiia bacterium]
MEASSPRLPLLARLQPGTQVLVRNSLNLWSPGFRIEVWRDDDRCQVRRNSDDALLPLSFATEDIRTV